MIKNDVVVVLAVIAVGIFVVVLTEPTPLPYQEGILPHWAPPYHPWLPNTSHPNTSHHLLVIEVNNVCGVEGDDVLCVG